MNRFACQLGTLALVSVAGAAAATDPLPQKQSASEQSVRVLKIQSRELLTILGGGPPCDLDHAATTSCPIKVEFHLINGKMYCIAIAPEVTGKVQAGNGNGDNVKNIVWHLAPNTHDGRVLEFHSEAGIVTTVDHKGLIVPKSGAHGDGSGGGSKNFYHVKARRNVKAEAGYLPIVMWGTGLDAELCAAPDPKIGNN